MLSLSHLNLDIFSGGKPSVQVVFLSCIKHCAIGCKLCRIWPGQDLTDSHSVGIRPYLEAIVDQVSDKGQLSAAALQNDIIDLFSSEFRISKQITDAFFYLPLLVQSEPIEVFSR